MTTLTLITNTGLKTAPVRAPSESVGIARAKSTAERLGCTAQVRVDGKLVYVAAPKFGSVE